MIGKIINKVINPFGFKIERTVESNSPSDADGYAEYLKQATNMGMDVNDYLTTVLGWTCPLSTLKSVLFPYINPSSNIIEIGQGTGRASRHLANYLSSGNLLLADVSEWFTNFSVQYFHDYGNVIVKKINNKLLPNFDNCVPNVLFAEGVFTYLLCQYIYIYIDQFKRVSAPDSIVCFGYKSYTCPEGLKTLFRVCEAGTIHNTFYSDDLIKLICEKCDYEIVKIIEQTPNLSNSYVIARKK